MEETCDSKTLETIKSSMQEHCKNMEVVKTEDIKEEVTNIDSPSAIKGSFGFESMKQMTFGCDLPSHEAVFESIKCEEEIKKEKITSYDTEMSIKTEINYTKVESDVEYEEIKSMKVENIKMEPGIEYSDGIEVDVEKQNTIQYCQYNGQEYETDDVARDSKQKNKTKQHQSPPLAFEVKDESLLQVQINEFHCVLCDFKTKYKANVLQHHRFKHDDAAEIFHCTLCDYKTKRSDHLVRHHTSKHDNTAKILCCKLCDYKTKRKDKLSQHHRLIHDNAAEILHCKFCDYKTKRKGNLVQHHTLKHDDLAEIFHCDRCDYKTKNKYRLLQHQRVKHNDSCEIFHCNLCYYETKYKCDWLRHHKSKHISPEIYHCKLCDFKTNHKGYMLRHHRSKHDE